ncbi:MAG TPA: hypothetical protein VFY28_01120 [Candidatus Paceibacterota bacterium]|nr:hypothetical protein [Candidatus Paceibacterota bacterium]
MQLTAEKIAEDFNLALANRHKEATRSGVRYEFNFAELTREINDFRQLNYPDIPADTLPSVEEIEAAVRKKWSVKSSATRRRRAQLKKKRKAMEADAARQFQLL